MKKRKQAVLRCLITTRARDWWRYDSRLEVRSGHKGTGKLLYSKWLAPCADDAQVWLAAEKVAREHDVDVYVETDRFVSNNCCVRYIPDAEHCVHLPTEVFFNEPLSGNDYYKWKWALA